MPRCFIIQPFDEGRYDKLYVDVFKPAIEKAGIESYRVDTDPSVSIPIIDIENGIRNSDLCFVEITTDNPNVWFELGFAIAVPKDVILICSEDRKSKFPFDVQHRNIIKYKSESLSDFDQLSNKITERAKAITSKRNDFAILKNSKLIADTEGLSQYEMLALVSVMQNNFSPIEGVDVHSIRQDMNNAGANNLAVSLALVSLMRKALLIIDTKQDWNGNPYNTYHVTPEGENWLLNNQDKLILQYSKETPEKDKSNQLFDSTDDLLF